MATEWPRQVTEEVAEVNKTSGRTKCPTMVLSNRHQNKTNKTS